ncbi:hypothetical protein TURU_082024 [Turdus rufiventris]|nr:hypothetical protein TURU_082024 [Turdus rufiventris]
MAESSELLWRRHTAHTISGCLPTFMAKATHGSRSHAFTAKATQGPRLQGAVLAIPEVQMGLIEPLVGRRRKHIIASKNAVNECGNHGRINPPVRNRSNNCLHVFRVYQRVNELCYDNTHLDMCVMEGRTYWVGKNLKFENGLISDGKPIIIDLLEENDEQVCAQFENTFCFSRNKESMDPESKTEQIALEKTRIRNEKEETRTRKVENLKLIHSVVQGMQIAAMPMNPELASGRVNGEKINRPGMLDTGADVTIIAHSEWLANWELQPVAGMISGIGGVTVSMQSKHNVIVKGPDGKLATMCLFLDLKIHPPYANGM